MTDRGEFIAPRDGALSRAVKTTVRAPHGGAHINLAGGEVNEGPRIDVD